MRPPCCMQSKSPPGGRCRGRGRNSVSVASISPTFGASWRPGSSFPRCRPISYRCLDRQLCNILTGFGATTGQLGCGPPGGAARRGPGPTDTLTPAPDSPDQAARHHSNQFWCGVASSIPRRRSQLRPQSLSGELAAVRPEWRSRVSPTGLAGNLVRRVLFTDERPDHMAGAA